MKRLRPHLRLLNQNYSAILVIIMSKKTEHTFIGTHARIALSDWSTLADLVIKHGKLIKEQAHETESSEESSPLPHVISQREIEDALEGPLQSFFKDKMTAYARIAKVQLNLTMREDDSFKDKRAELSDEDKIPEALLEKTSTSDLAKMQRDLNELTKTHEEEWQQCRDQWSQHILEHLNSEGLALSDIEIKEFMDAEPLSELMERYVVLNIELPKTKKSEMNFSKYLTLKANITIQSALSRQHLPNTSADIQKVLGKLKSVFSDIAKQESELINTQKATTQEVITSIAQA